MQVVKKTKEHTILKKRSGRFGVRDSGKKWISGNDKVKILTDAGLITPPVKKAAPSAEAAPTENTEKAGE